GGGAGRDPSYKMGEGIVFSTVFFWRLRPEIGSNCHPVGSSSKTPSDALQTFSMETGQAGGESAAECGSGGRFSAGGRFYQVKSAIEHNGHYARWFGRRGGALWSAEDSLVSWGLTCYLAGLDGFGQRPGVAVLIGKNRYLTYVMRTNNFRCRMTGISIK
uniref:hypothetical protein n=1 Tax=Aeromonas allosaccharophila TaxID=656 RepID=UPI003D216A69